MKKLIVFIFCLFPVYPQHSPQLINPEVRLEVKLENLNKDLHELDQLLKLYESV